MRERRAHYEQQNSLVEDILHTGNERMRAEAADTMQRVHEAMGITYFR